jgi:hypothetical protein
MCTTCNQGLNGEIALGLAQEFYRRMQGHPDTDMWGFAATILSKALGKVGKDAEAETLCRESLSVLEQPGRGGPVVAKALIDLRDELASTLGSQGKDAEALPIVERCVAEALLHDGPDSKSTLDSRSKLASVLLALERPAEATKILLDIYDRAKRVFGAEDRCTLDAKRVFGAEDRCTLDFFGVLLAHALMAGKEAEGQAMLEELLPVLKRVFGPEHRAYLEALEMYAIVVFHSDRLVEAEAMLAEVLQVQRLQDCKTAEITS